MLTRFIVCWAMWLALTNLAWMGFLRFFYLLSTHHHFWNRTGPWSVSQAPSTWTRLRCKPWCFPKQSWTAAWKEAHLKFSLYGMSLQQTCSYTQVVRKKRRSKNNMQRRTAKEKTQPKVSRRIGVSTVCREEYICTNICVFLPQFLYHRM